MRFTRTHRAITQLRIARQYGILHDLLLLAWSDLWERIWLCRILHSHQAKLGRPGRCHRCGKRL